MEQVEGGDLVVNKGHESKPREQGSDAPRNMNAVDGIEAAFRLAEVMLHIYSPVFASILKIYRQTYRSL